MMDYLISMVTVLNAVSNAAGGILFAPAAWLPGWLFLTTVSAAAGVVLLVVFKHTSNQKAIGRTRDGISASLLAVRLFRDSFSVALRSQARVFAGAFRLLLHSLVPLCIIIIPVSLMLVQMGLWYQARPLRPGDDAVMVKLVMNAPLDRVPQVSLEPLPAAPAVMGPVRITSKGEIYWKIKPVENGDHTLVFRVGDRRYEKQLAIGEGFMRVSVKRPGQDAGDILLHPLEKPFTSDVPVRSISIAYPGRDSTLYGTDRWMLCFFAVSMAFALLFKPLLNVRI